MTFSISGRLGLEGSSEKGWLTSWLAGWPVKRWAVEWQKIDPNRSKGGGPFWIDFH